MTFHDRGIRKRTRAADYALAALQAYGDWGTTIQNREQLGRRLAAFAGNQLNLSRTVPPQVEFASLERGTRGEFDFERWTLQLSSRYLSGSKQPSVDSFLEVANTVYHESRHCEQWFLMARAMAGHWSLSKLKSAMTIPSHVARAAKARQIPKQNQTIFNYGREFYIAVYGAGGQHRTDTFKALDDPNDPTAWHQYRALIEEDDAFGAGEEASDLIADFFVVEQKGREARQDRGLAPGAAARSAHRTEARRKRCMRHGEARRRRVQALRQVA